jgi:uncharacterized membrane protein YebE (DUF533 family)
MTDIRRTPDGVANPDWVLETASRPVGDRGSKNPSSPANLPALRRAAVDGALASKVLNGHLRNRLQLMQSNPTELGGLAPGDAALLLRAMMAAGHADGMLGDDERRRLVSIAERGIGDDELRQSLLRAIDSPPALEDIARRVESPEIAERVYAVSAATVGHLSEVNRAYLAYLAARLGVAQDVVLRINASTEVAAGKD